MATSGFTLAKRGSHLVFFLVLAGHTLLISSQVTTRRGHSALRGAIIGYSVSFAERWGGVLNGIHSAWYGYFDLRGVREENSELREKVARLEQTLWMEREIVASHDRVSQVLDLAERFPFESLVAEVVGLDASAWFRTVTVNRGLEHGVELNAPVVGQGGVVGRVIAVGSSVAQVQLLSDRDCSVGALLVTRTFAGNSFWHGDNELQMKYVSNLEDVTIGDLVVTSGIDGMYPEGDCNRACGHRENGPRLFKIITIEPAARLDRLEEVFILECSGQ